MAFSVVPSYRLYVAPVSCHLNDLNGFIMGLGGMDGEDERRRESEHDDGSSEDEDEGGGDGGLAGGADLYEVLGLTKEATASDIKKAYHKMALRLHPDKNPSPDAAAKFQTLQKVYGVLGDADKRKVYDETGSTDDAELSGEKFNNLYDYYRGIYKKVTEEDIDDFFATYRGSEEEARDVREAYAKFSGDMAKVFMWVMCSDDKLDSHRFADLVDAAIDSGELKPSQKFSKWAAIVRRQPAPKNPLKPQKKKKGKQGGSDGDLMALIQARQSARASQADDLFASLEAKYGGGSKGKGGAGKKRGKEGATGVKEGGVSKKKK